MNTPGFGINTPEFVLDADRHTEKDRSAATDAILAGTLRDLLD